MSGHLIAFEGLDQSGKQTQAERLIEAFELTEVRLAMRAGIETRPIRAIYASGRHRELLVLDKENGGKADALNAGVNAAHYPYICAVDADAVLEQDALIRVAKPILNEPELIAATGGIVRIANGCKIDGAENTQPVKFSTIVRDRMRPNGHTGAVEVGD